MCKSTMPEKWDAVIYLRLSRFDKDKHGRNKDESNSIKNQRDLILDFVEKNPDIRVVDTLVDDGVSGAHFNRDAFKDMINHIECGTVNCVIVKDFSRLGRNHIEMGKYMERYFAIKNVRFIAINEPYDSLYSDMSDRQNRLIVPFKHILNESSLEDTSKKTKSNLAIKRKNGEFVCNYTVYGYVKSADKKLIVDDFAAEVVKAIFDYKLNGYNEQQIAAMLNAKNILSPAEYKKMSGENYKTPFAVNNKSSWTANAVKRVLTNRVYIGCLEQGKRTKISYRMKKHYYKPREEWSVHENNHEPIIDAWDFELVQELLAQDTRITPGSGVINMFSGFVICGYCGRPMIVKTTKKANGASYVNYICSTHKKYGTCRIYNASAIAIEQFTLMSVQNQVRIFLDTGDVLVNENLLKLKTRKQIAIESMIDRHMQAIHDNQILLAKCFEHFDGKIITEDEYRIFKTAFSNRVIESEKSITALREEIQRIENGNQNMEHIKRFKQYGNITMLDRRTIATLIKSITVLGGKAFEITFRYTADFCESALIPEKAVV